MGRSATVEQHPAADEPANRNQRSLTDQERSFFENGRNDGKSESGPISPLRELHV
jgi:hypothetical protein